MRGIFLLPIAPLLADNATQRTSRVWLNTDRRELCGAFLKARRGQRPQQRFHCQPNGQQPCVAVGVGAAFDALTH